MNKRIKYDQTKPTDYTGDSGISAKKEKGRYRIRSKISKENFIMKASSKLGITLTINNDYNDIK